MADTADTGRICARIAELRGQINGAKYVAGAIAILIMALAGAWGHNLKQIVVAQASDNKSRIASHEKTLVKDGLAIERYDANIKEQNRRLNRIEDDVKEIKVDQKEMIRKMDRVLMEKPKDRP